MSIEFCCDCRAVIRVSDAKAGKAMRCPECGDTVTVPDDDEVEDRRGRKPAGPSNQTVRFLGGHYKPVRGPTRMIVAGVGLLLLVASAALILSFDRAAPIRMRSLIAAAVLTSISIILLLVGASGYTADLEATMRQQQQNDRKRNKRKR